MIYDSNDTIIACSTGGVTNAAIAVIRISGKLFLDKLNPFFSIDVEKITPRYAHFCQLLDENERKLDEIILTYYKAPSSYNGEDILEISVHGNRLNVKRVIDLFVVKCQLRIARPGEFSYRAMANKKLNLNQVEGLDLFLNANTIFSLDQGLSLLSGKLQESFKELYNCFLDHKSSLELGFDFLEDIGEEQFTEQFNKSFKMLKKQINQLHSQSLNQGANLIKPEVVIYGPPNAGKSTFFNKMLNQDRAIVSSIAGTTRDFIREDLGIKNDIFSLIDTAGIRSSKDKIEAIGIDKALKLTESAFFRILVINPFDFNNDYFSSLEHIKFDLILVGHKDREGFETAYQSFLANVSKQFRTRLAPVGPGENAPIGPGESAPIGPGENAPIGPGENAPIGPGENAPIGPGENAPIGPVFVNFKEDGTEIVHDVKKHIYTKYLKTLDFDPVLIERHSISIKNIYTSLSRYESIISSEDDMAVIGSELNILGHCISELIGIVSADDVLRNIFSNFCIGK